MPDAIEGLSRRSLLRAVPAAGLAAGTVSFRDAIVASADDLRRSGKAMILLWMAGGPPQFETFAPDKSLSEFKPISTATPGVEVSELFPEVARASDDWCFIRSMTNKEGEHQRASYQVHTGYVPSGSVRHPGIGSSIGQQLSGRPGAPPSDLPPVAAIARVGAIPGAGFIGVDYEPFVVTDPGQPPRNLATNVSKSRFRRRLSLVDQLDAQFGRGANAALAKEHRDLYRQTAELVTSRDTEAFDLSGEPDALVQAYGDSDFGRGCLLARRLIERGVRFVEVVSPGWDMHDDLGERMMAKADEVDPAMATLIEDLRLRGMLDDTLVAWMGEFGRTPKINARGGRDHYPQAFTAASAGGGVRGGQVIGKSSRDGSVVADNPVSVGDLHATFCRSLGIDPHYEHMSPLGRPMKIVENGSPVEAVFSGAA